jgi:myosin heavy subunit
VARLRGYSGKGVFKMKRIMHLWWIVLLVLLAIWAVPGCGDNEEPREKNASVSKEDVKQETKEAYEAIKNYTQEQMQTFREQSQSKLAEFEKKIDGLKAKAEGWEGDAMVAAEQQLTALRLKRDQLSEKLKELGSSTGNAWEQLKSGIDAAMDDLDNAYEKAAAEFDKS